MTSVFLVVEPSKIILLIKILYPKGGYDLTLYFGTIVPPNKILLVNPPLRSLDYSSYELRRSRVVLGLRVSGLGVKGLRLRGQGLGL